jgi:hypothetical protein
MIASLGLPEFEDDIVSDIGHPVKYKHSDGSLTTYPRNKDIKLKSREFSINTKDDIEVVRKVYFPTKHIPEYEPGVYHIVSKIVAVMYAGIRDDLVYPGTHPFHDNAYYTDGELEHIKRFRLPDIMMEPIETIDERITKSEIMEE